MRDQIKYDGFFISYTDQSEVNPFDMISVMLGGIKEDNFQRPETALCVSSEDTMTGYKYYILYGDWRKEYNTVAHKGLDACLELFNKHLEHVTDTSDLLTRNSSIN